MATRRVSPLHRPIQLSATPEPQCSDRLAVPKYHTLDPLLGNLSPESTLQALSSINAVPKNERVAHDILYKSISQVSPAERALGIRAAVAAQKLGIWHKEIQAWEWPKRTNLHLGKGFIPPSADVATEYYGSLPATVVKEHENRIEEIRDGMESLNVEELKEHVLNAHIPARSRPSSSHSTMSIPPPLSYVQLSDFTAVITATILRALPLLSRLNNILSTWDVRLLVLHQVPGLLQSLQFARSELDFALNILKSSDPPTEQDPLYSISNYHVKRLSLESIVVSTGRRMDRLLDALEGREDSLPESWIDDLEAIEGDFGTWVVQAEKCSVKNEWSRTAIRSKRNEVTESAETLLETTEPRFANDSVANRPIIHNAIPQSPEPQSVVLPPTPHSENQEFEPEHGPITLQIRQSTPMETIVEEIGNPSELVPSDTDKLLENKSVGQAVVTPHSTGSSISSISKVSTERNEDSNMNVDSFCNAPPTFLAHEQIVDTEVVVGQPSAVGPSLDELLLSIDECNEDSVIIYPQAASSSLIQDDVLSKASSEDSVYEARSEVQPGSDPDMRPSCPEMPELEQLSPVDGISSHTPPATPPLAVSPSEQTDAKNIVSSQPFKTPESSPCLEYRLPSPVEIEPKVCEDLEPIAEVEISQQPTVVENKLAPAYVESVVPEQVANVSAIPTDIPPARSLSPLLESPNLFVPFDGSRTFPADRHPETAEQTNEDSAPRQHLESPIKLSKNRPGRLDLSKHNSKPSGRPSSNASAGSLSDYPSLVSSPEVPEPRSSSSNGTPILLKTPPRFPADYQPSETVPPSNDHTLREDRLFRLDSQKRSPRDSFSHNRTLSLPLQRFINERLDLNYANEPNVDEDGFTVEKPSPVGASRSPPDSDQKASVMQHQKARSFTPTNNMPRLAGQPLGFPKEEGSGPESDGSNGVPLKAQECNKKAFSKNSRRDTHKAQPPTNPKTARLRKQLTAHPSLESIGAYRSSTRFPEEVDNSNFEKIDSRSSTPSHHLIRPKDEMDEKINSILTTLPTRIHLVSADQDGDASSVASSLPFKGRERFRSHSPQSTPSRSGTPTPSLTLRPARRRHSHAYAPEESSVKLYHLHRGGKSAPTKLFVRSVGENGERVMVRVGGGWADLGEYLREYAIHHGRRHVSETPRVEVEGLSTRESPSYSPPGNRHQPAGSGRHTPARPRSVISNRPSSSLAVRKTRRPSNVSDIGDFRAAPASDPPNPPFSPMSSVFPRRRLSVSSNVSAGAVSSVSEARQCSPSGPAIPLGLAGPKPRAKHVAISAESEAWVEDVLGQARRSSSLRPFKHSLPDYEPTEPKLSSALPKARSISDIGKAGSSKRVILRGLNNR